MTDPSRGRLLERDAELAAVRDLLDEVRRGRGRVLAVRGSAGIGKTSLLAEAGRLGAASGVSVLTAHAAELERDFAFGVARQLLEVPVAALAPAVREAVLSGAAALARPVLAAEEPSTGHPADQAAVVHGLYWVCVGLSDLAPSVLVVDDLHWADPASVRFLAYVARRLEGLPLALLTAFRPPADVEQADLVAAVVGDALLEPAPLGPGSVAAIVRERVAAADDAVCRACHEVTGGNPFLATTLAGALAEQGGPPQVAAAQVSDVVLARLGRLPPAATALARAVAVLGTDADPATAARLAGLDAAQAAAAADGLAAREVLRYGRPLEFVHPLVLAAVRDGVPAAERALAHARAARLLAEAGRPAAAIAVHLLAAEPAGDPAVVRTLRAAAAGAAGQGVPETAAAYLRRALAEPPPPGERGPVLHELGIAEIRAAQHEEGVAHLQEALNHLDAPRRRCAVALDLALGLVAPGRYAEATRMLEQVAAEAEGEDADLARGVEAELIVAATMLPATYGLVQRRLPQLPVHLAGAGPGERALLAAAALEAVLRGGPAAAAAGPARRAYEGGLIGEAGGDSGMAINVVFALVVAEEFELATRTSDAALADVGARGSLVGFARQSCFRSMLHLRRGELAEAEASAQAAVEAGRQGGYRIGAMACAPLLDCLVARGDLDGADEVLRVAGLDGAVPDTLMLNFVLHARGWLRLAQSRLAEARADFAELGRRESGWRPWNPAMFPYRSGLALVLRAAGESGAATALAEDELERARQWGTAGVVGRALRGLGLARGGDEAVQHLRASVDVLSASDARLELAQSLVELGAAQRRLGHRTAARDPLARGLELADRCGAPALAERAREELRATGARPRRAARTGVDALTPTERRVARMAADGLTNREIAQALFVTLRTVEVHLTHAYQKLGEVGRERLAEILSGGTTTRA